MVTNVTSLLKTVKAVEDEHTRGTRALESTVEAIGQEMRVSVKNNTKSEQKLLLESDIRTNGFRLYLYYCDEPKSFEKSQIMLFWEQSFN